MRSLLRVGMVSASVMIPIGAHAHSFGTPYILPVPFWMYLFGCAATLVLTFCLLGFFVTEPTKGSAARPPQVAWPGVTHVVSRCGLRLLRAAAAGCLLLTVLSGFIDAQPDRNIGMALFWVFFLLGLTYLTVFIGDLFALINPWASAIDGLERIGLNLSIARIEYPQKLSYWPALMGYVALVWIELHAGTKPLVTSIALVVYTVITIVGASTFGKHIWLQYAEPFGIFFRLVGTLAPLEYRRDRHGLSWSVMPRAPLAGAMTQSPDQLSLLLFVLFMLSSVTYDGIHETQLWIGFFWSNMLWLLQPLWGADLHKAQRMLIGWYLIYRQLGLVLFLLVYLSLYLLTLLAVKSLTQTTLSLYTLSLRFAYSLVPIAVAYSFAHYYAWLYCEILNIPSLLSDPFGKGWNWLRVQRSFDQPVLQVGWVWHIEVAVLLLGHCASVWLTHFAALRTLSGPRNAMVGQLPLLALMIFYTVFGLWILALPLGAAASG